MIPANDNIDLDKITQNMTREAAEIFKEAILTARRILK